MPTKAQADLARSQSLLDRVTGDDQKPVTNYCRVSWHSKQKSWRVKVKRGDREFYKEFRDVDVAAWVADCAALLVHGRDGAYDRDGRYCLNFPWKGDTPTCPDPDITPMTVYGWLLDRDVPVLFKPSGLH